MTEYQNSGTRLRELSGSDNAPSQAMQNAEQISSSVGQAFYVWDIASDKIEWSRGFRQLTGLSSCEEKHLSGRGYEGMLDGSSKETRFGTIISSGKISENGEPVPYQCTYNIRPSEQADNAHPIWIEDTGTWYPDDAGRPMRAEGLVRVVTDRRNREEELRRKSDFDDQTGLPNRRTLEMLISKAVRESQNDGKISAFLILSIERLNMINDIYGFETGDFVLKKAGQLIREKLRAGDAVCRFSGSKFGILLKNCPPAEIYDAARRLLSALSSEVIKAPSGYVSANGIIGACFLPQHATTPNEAFQAAFLGMKLARVDSQNRVGVYFSNPEKEAENERQAQFSTEVVSALEEGRVKLVFQPIVNSEKKPVIHEALVRLETSDGVVESAQEFITMVERLGLIRIVDRRVLELVLQTLRDYPDAELSVNVSHDTVLDPEWLSNLATGLVTVENGASRLIVEITESLASVDIRETKRFIENVKALGCRVAIDDFGAGFTSFANLKYLPVDIIKIDGSFGLKITENKENQVFVQSLLALAKAYDLQVVVEWIEDEASATMMFDWGVDLLQGHQFGAATSEMPWERAIVDDEEEKLAIGSVA